MNKTPALFNLHEIDKKYPHLFDPGEVPKSLFLAVTQHVESEDGIPEAKITVTQFIRLDLLKGKPYEDEVREMVGLPPRKVKEAE